MHGVVPGWGLVNAQGAFALRVPVGRGEVTGTAIALPVANQNEAKRSLEGLRVGTSLTDEDNALTVAAILDLPSHRRVVYVEDEAREPLRTWIWRHARAPLLLAVAAIALALWRLVVRFGPREAAHAQARRSMGEQVRGTGAFIASHEPAALHAATRHALDAAARARVEGWHDLDDAERVDALHARTALDRATLAAALRPAARASAAQWLAATSLLEQARRALLRAAH